MTTLQAALLGLLQGVTEFLPVSSSGHLLIAQEMLGVQEPGNTLEIALHFGTLLAILVVFRRAAWRVICDAFTGLRICIGRGGRDALRERAPQFPVAIAIVVGSVPTAIAGFLIKARFEGLLDSLPLCGAGLLLTGLMLLALRWVRSEGDNELPAKRGLLIGCAQAVAILPGVSRSGSTIAAARFLGVDRGTAATFSFLLAIPAMFGAGMLEVVQMLRSQAASVPAVALLVGTAVSFAVGAVSLVLLLRVIRRGKFHWFAAYCIPLGLLVLVFA
jgi:undecaprenyl-diphosphatase